jgi:hypothetical protein
LAQSLTTLLPSSRTTNLESIAQSLPYSPFFTSVLAAGHCEIAKKSYANLKQAPNLMAAKEAVFDI